MTGIETDHLPRRIRVRLFLYRYYSQAELYWGMQVGAAGIFLKLAWKALTGQIVIVNSEEIKSRGGYKYLGLSVSKRPLSKDHDYTNFI